ncbi:GNAT family N-acetyltransferase [Litorilituus sediminis]|uniref:N-acetyltransferase n=1 Tax=Litorilituus sediminis TaxID=718192 RepID=A0A4P6P648_9GAMM|nr:GNAT family protein [Litorilituus sediminis]QBG37176.1 N-acetyltransferase [Litorilituus sediminis]
MFNPVTLASQKITLEPLTIAHLDAFQLAGNFEQVWQHMPMNRCKDQETARQWLNIALKEMAQGKEIGFATIDKASNTLVGSTRMIRLNSTHKKLEIGYTFITPKFQRSYVNSHAKFLMLQHAFEHLGMVRVEICTHEDNQQSRTAIARIGGQFEGILRKHRRNPDNSYRNTAMFSITDDDWPQVKQALLATGSSEQEFYHSQVA